VRCSSVTRRKSRMKLADGLEGIHADVEIRQSHLLGKSNYRTAARIELLINFTKSSVFTVLPSASQISWSQLGLINSKAPSNSW
jgi:hypothetical protein